MTADLNKYSVRTDLALEAREMAQPDIHVPLPGVEEHVENVAGIKVTNLNVYNEEGSRVMGRVQGRYLTLEVPALRKKDSDLQDRVATKFAQLFEKYLIDAGVKSTDKVLIVGLGNSNVTPDALGPMVVENILVTRHYFELVPEQVSPGYRQVSAVAPGVLGTTGIESSEIVHAIVEKTRPDVIIAIDALASKALERVNTTIQVADIGIHPGSGIGNKRKGLTKEILGIPCIAIGVPTVCYASTIVNNAIELMKEHFKHENVKSRDVIGLLDEVSEQERLQLVKEVLEPLGHDVIVTPKEVDEFIEDMANIIASGLNAALHEAVDTNNVAAYTH